jgi:hypothetical protein
METVSDLIEAYGGVAAFARVIGKSSSTASEMKRRGSVPVAYWPKLIASAGRLGIAGITAERLMWLHVPADIPRPLPPAAANDDAPAREEAA